MKNTGQRVNVRCVIIDVALKMAGCSLFIYKVRAYCMCFLGFELYEVVVRSMETSCCFLRKIKDSGRLNTSCIGVYLCARERNQEHVEKYITRNVIIYTSCMTFVE